MSQPQFPLSLFFPATPTPLLSPTMSPFHFLLRKEQAFKDKVSGGCQEHTAHGPTKQDSPGLPEMKVESADMHGSAPGPLHFISF